jgi:hypothetical protein
MDGHSVSARTTPGSGHLDTFKAIDCPSISAIGSLNPGEVPITVQHNTCLDTTAPDNDLTSPNYHKTPIVYLSYKATVATNPGGTTCKMTVYSDKSCKNYISEIYPMMGASPCLNIIPQGTTAIGLVAQSANFSCFTPINSPTTISGNSYTVKEPACSLAGQAGDLDDPLMYMYYPLPIDTCVSTSETFSSYFAFISVSRLNSHPFSLGTLCAVKIY